MKMTFKDMFPIVVRQKQDQLSVRLGLHEKEKNKTEHEEKLYEKGALASRLVPEHS